MITIMASVTEGAIASGVSEAAAGAQGAQAAFTIAAIVSLPLIVGAFLIRKPADQQGPDARRPLTRCATYRGRTHPSRRVGCCGSLGAFACDAREEATVIVTPPAVGEVEGHAAEMYASDLNDDGFVYSHTQVMAINPEAHEAFEALIARDRPLDRRAHLRTGDARRRPRHPLSALPARARPQDTCAAELFDEDQLERVARDYETAGLDDADVAVMRFAEKVSTDAAAMTDADSQTLRDHGFSDRQIVDIALAAGARNFLSRTLQALDVPVEDVPGLSPRLVRTHCSRRLR